MSGRDVVLPVVPDVAPAPERTEWLRLRVPPGTVALRVPTPLPVVAEVDGTQITPVDGIVQMPTHHGPDVLLRVTARDGRRGGALLDGPVELASLGGVAAPCLAPGIAWPPPPAATEDTRADLHHIPDETLRYRRAV